MFGVVIWSDRTDQKAVIWCEDQGDLAYFRAAEYGPEANLESGDWVEFDVSLDRSQRLAQTRYPSSAGRGCAPATDPGPRSGQRPRRRAATPVRAISARPSGRMRSAKASIFSGAPVISKMKLSSVVSTTLARKISAMRMASTRLSP